MAQLQSESFQNGNKAEKKLPGRNSEERGAQPVNGASRGEMKAVVDKIKKLTSIKSLAVLAAIPAAIMTFSLGIRFLASAFATQDLSPDIFWEKIFEGTLLLALAAALMTLAYTVCRQNRRLEAERQSIKDGRMQISFQLDAMKRHSIVTETDPDGNYRDVNENFEKLFGYTRDEIIGRSASILFEDGRNDRHYKELRETIKRGEVFSGEQELVSRQGKRVWVQSTAVPVFDPEGNHLHTITLRTDVTAKRKAEADHYQTELLKELPDEVFIYRVEDRKIVFMNNRALKRCGWSREEASRKTIADTTPDFDMEVFNSHVRPLLAGQEKTVTLQTRNQDTDVEITTRLHVLPDNEQVFVSILRDITEHKRRERHRLQVVSNVSHELRTPLTSIRGSLRLLKSGVAGDLPQEGIQLVDIADRNTDRMLNVLNDILDFEKIVAGKMEMEMAAVHLDEFVREAIAVNSGYAVEHHVNFKAGKLPEGAVITGDRNRLMQVMSNLMSNAAKFSPEGEDVVISVSDRGDAWRISVADKGPGIPPESREKVFESFAQLEPADGKPRKGTGLGLAITRRIIKLHAGHIDFESTLGEGTTFHIDLPKTRVEKAPDGEEMELAA